MPPHAWTERLHPDYFPWPVAAIQFFRKNSLDHEPASGPRRARLRPLRVLWGSSARPVSCPPFGLAIEPQLLCEF